MSHSLTICAIPLWMRALVQTLGNEHACYTAASQVSARNVTAAVPIRASGVMAACIEGDSNVKYLEMNAFV